MSTTLAVVLAAALAWCHGWWAHGRTTAERAERTARPPDPHPAALADWMALGWQALNEACCLRNWEAGGRSDVHDPATCTRKDQTT